MRLLKEQNIISTTKIENSFYNASKGIYFVDEFYISDIAPRREPLQNEAYDNISFEGPNQKILKIKKNDIKVKNLVSCSAVINKIVKRTKNKI